MSVSYAHAEDDHQCYVLGAVGKLAAVWDSKLAPALFLHAHRIAVIGKNHPTDCDACLNGVVQEWLRKNYDFEKVGYPSWRLLVTAVSKIDMALALTIAKDHLGEWYVPCGLFFSFLLSLSVEGAQVPELSPTLPQGTQSYLKYVKWFKSILLPLPGLSPASPVGTATELSVLS